MSDNVIQAVIFDLGKVLVDFDWQKAARRLAPFCALNAEEIPAAVEDSGLIVPYECGEIDDDEFCMGLIDYLNANVSIEEMALFWTEIFIRRPEMEKLFRDVRRHVPVAILSDTSPLHWRYIRDFAPPIAEPDGLVLSYEVGSKKPALRNFSLAAATIKAPPAACVFFDDRPENVEAATKAGMQAFVYQNARHTRDTVFAMLESGKL